MLTLRCTKKLLTRLKQRPEPAPPPSTTRLGDWYVNLVYIGRQQLVLAISEKTLLAVVLKAAPIATLTERLVPAVGEILTEVGVPRELRELELAQMRDVTIAKTANRRVLGTMNDFMRAMEFHVPEEPSLLMVSLCLAGTPCGPLFKSHSFPDRETLAVFDTPLLRVVR